jgi:hypothetical protein
MDPIDFWGRRARPFYGGAIGTQATLGLLAELGLPRLPQVQAACENLLEYGQLDDGGFSYDGAPDHQMVCSTGNSIRTLVYFGYGGDERVNGALDYLVTRASTPGALACPLCEEDVCRWGLVKALSGFASLPRETRTPEHTQAIENLVNSLLDYEFDFEERDSNWLQFGFPLDYESDLVELCDILSALGYGPDPRLDLLMSLVMAARTDDGRWIKRYGTRALQVEKRGSPSKWITIRALRAARRATSSLAQAARSALRKLERR